MELDDSQTVLVTVPDLAGRLVGKRFDAEFFRRSATNGVRTCDVVLGWGIGHELLDGFGQVGWAHGYGDFIAIPDHSSMRTLAWWPHTALIMADAVTDAGDPIAIAPREVLRQQIARASMAGFTPIVASELEFTVFDESPQSLADKGYVNLNPHGHRLSPELVETIGIDEPFFADVRHRLSASGIPVESFKAEYSIGQFELTISAAPALRSADNHAVYKLGIREMSRQAGLVSTFMAKWDDRFGGSGCHLHMSLQDEGGRNVFAEGDDSCLRHFIGGLQHYARDVFLLWAPYPNSYKRFQLDTFAPTSLSWGTDNRTAAFRVTGRDTARHLENRIPGADINPYLAYAALLAAGLAGVEERIEPDAGIAHHNAYTTPGLAQVPTTVDEALDLFRTSEFTRARFGPEVVDHIANFAAKERDAARSAVTDWDRRRLFDI